MVSHGGWIRELIGLVLEDYSCNGIPLKRWQLCCPNTGITTLKIAIYKEGDVDVASMDCMLYQCKRHLNSISEGTCKCSSCDDNIKL